MRLNYESKGYEVTRKTLFAQSHTNQTLIKIKLIVQNPLVWFSLKVWFSFVWFSLKVAKALLCINLNIAFLYVYFQLISGFELLYLPFTRINFWP